MSSPHAFSLREAFCESRSGASRRIILGTLLDRPGEG
jgi:hypothetical protein